MGKKQKSRSKQSKPLPRQPGEIKNKFAYPTWVQDILFPVILALFLVILLKPFVVDGLSPQGVDVTASIAINHQAQEYAKESGEPALWNPNIFAGMPRYHRFGPRAWSLDNLLLLLGRLFNHIFMFYLFGGLGLYLLLRYKKMSPLVSFVGALAFVLMPHYKALYAVGHFTKFRAIMCLPWIYLTFIYFLEKRNLLSAALFALAFGLQIRTQHYQIVFYTGIMIFALGIYPLLRDLLDKKYGMFAKSSGMLLAGLTLAILMSSQPLFQAREYLPFSKRGKQTVSVNDKATTEKSDGVSMQYATQWSTHPSELLTWLVPRFYGGMSTEKYQGDLIPQSRNRAIQIPGYWGHMPFTQSYEYMGALILILAVLGFVANRRKKRYIAALVFLIFLVLLSFGRHFEMFYSLFYDHFPFFNKFRAPMMSVVVSYFIIVLFAFAGVAYLKEIREGMFSWEKYKPILYTFAGFLGLGILLLIYGQMAEFLKPGGEPYQAETMEVIRRVRAEFFNQDVIRYLLIVALSAGAVYAYLRSKVNYTMLVVLLGVIIVGDHLLVQNRIGEEMTDVKKLEKRYFAPTATDKFILKDQEIFRIMPYDRDILTKNRWVYFHQSISGYTPIKMYTIEEMVEKNIYNGWKAGIQVNWNTLKILNVKYLISRQDIQSPYLEKVYSDRGTGWNTYLYTDRLPRAHFVEEYTIVPDEIERLRTINRRDFDPGKTAIVEEKINEPIEPPDSSSTQMISFTPNRVEYQVYTDKQALLVLSEVYYPPGWKILIDDQLVGKIYKTDHAIQSVVVPAGAHRIEMRFEPDSYYRFLKVSYASLGVLYLVILLSLGHGWFSRKKVSD